MASSDKPVAFEITLDDSNVNNKADLPEKLRKRLSDCGGRPTTPDVLEEKQAKADRLRREYNQARIERIQQADKECKSLTSKVDPILIDETKPKSKAEAEKVIKDIQKDLQKMSIAPSAKK
ncbi:uncharacterized protein LOC135499914 [Lineus longissimus]|uniref:uncharacterized protein LOC135499914 n=1 Tax=Lineus longissimus TaxID=88925 RepID=UPI002B4C8198